jgi:hypothetical protein
LDNVLGVIGIGIFEKLLSWAPRIFAAPMLESVYYGAVGPSIAPRSCHREIE